MSFKGDAGDDSPITVATTFPKQDLLPSIVEEGVKKDSDSNVEHSKTEDSNGIGDQSVQAQENGSVTKVDLASNTLSTEEKTTKL